MSKRRKTTNRLTLFRTCGICGKHIVTTASTPWVRQVPRDGKKKATTYYCSEKCFAASYKHVGWYDGKTAKQRNPEEARRKQREINRRYYEAHAEAMRERMRQYYKAHPGKAAADSAYQRKKRALLRNTEGEEP